MLKANSLNTVPCAIFAQAKLSIKLPESIGKSTGNILTRQHQQLLITIDHQCGCGQEGAVDANLFCAPKKHGQVSINPFLSECPVFELQ